MQIVYHRSGFQNRVSFDEVFLPWTIVMIFLYEVLNKGNNKLMSDLNLPFAFEVK